MWGFWTGRTPGGIAIAALYVNGPVHRVGVFNDIPVRRMPENELRPLRDVAVEQIEAAVQVVGVADDSHTGGRVSGGVAPAHVVADLMGMEMSNQVGNQFWGTVASVLVISAGPPVRIGHDGGQGARAVCDHIKVRLV